jgi:hypothetical protein
MLELIGHHFYFFERDSVQSLPESGDDAEIETGAGRGDCRVQDL